VDATASAHLGAGGVQVSYGPAFVNQGLIEVKGNNAVLGVSIVELSADKSISALNAGTISASSAHGIATGLQTNTQSGQPVNAGLIDVSSGVSARDTFNGFSAMGWSAGSKFAQNDGQIIVHDLSSDAKGVAVAIGGLRGDVTTFVNTGLLQGDVAVQSFEEALSGTSQQTAAIVIRNSGMMIGQVNLANVSHSLTNSGSIIGATTFGSANDTYDGRGGSETGLLSGGAGADTLIGGSLFDNLQGNQGADSISGGGGDDIVVGGQDNDTLLGDGGSDIINGNLGDDTTDGGAGNDIVLGGQGNDVVRGGDGDDYVSGDKGNDTMTGGAGGDVFHGNVGIGVDLITDFNRAEGDIVRLDAGTAYTLAQVGANVVVSMGSAGDQLILQNVQLSTLTPGWIFN
jgi:Ca2+-binding RTX toxin-like protein